MIQNKCILLGTGTSQGVPVIGCECDVCQSDDQRDKRLRCSAFLKVKDLNLVIDTGPDFRQQMLRAGVKTIDGILITHEHNDHIAGLDDIRPFNFLQKEAISVYTSKRVMDELKKKFDYIFADQKYPGAPTVKLIEVGEGPFKIKNVDIEPIQYAHGRIPVLGFRLGDFAYITDIKSITRSEQDKLMGLSNLVVSALHHREHHSHFNLKEAIEFVNQIKPKQTYLTHISHRMGTFEAVSSTLPADVELAFDGLEVPISFG